MAKELKEELSPAEIGLLVRTMETLRDDLRKLADALHEAATDIEEEDV
ncbi:hypothetical protein RJO15_24310 [Herbaspirillum huttiense F1]|uniref:Uncharacterized protein n=1 Tax=Herbaspirillum huttiense subsp. lycopersici TaxID=3074428 RepID=A0ABU2ERJ9_9BURK|nr:hypothetical protein [Herbaspirillum huttiense]MDR9850771.1 hypothetical protein [Herbaspirillum huttiense SE1]MDT0358933.1 hypothetical protein [Herbaspirillum huttiense F1]